MTARDAMCVLCMCKDKAPLPKNESARRLQSQEPVWDIFLSNQAGLLTPVCPGRLTELSWWAGTWTSVLSKTEF